MKKRIAVIICFALIFVLTGCANNSSSGKHSGDQPAGVNTVLEQGVTEADDQQAKNTTRPAENNIQEPQSSESADTGSPEIGCPETAGVDAVDVDLAELSGTMVYAEVYNMVTSPEQYIGKTVRMKGLFNYYHDETTDNYYFACIIQDATACCAQGIEFVLTDDYVYPDDYPEVNEEICVTGVFDTYQEESGIYCTLRNAKLI